MIWFRHADPLFPFLREDSSQPVARWHSSSEGPAQYLANTPDGAWAEFLRHEDIADPKDLPTIRRAIWAIELPDEPFETPKLPETILLGDESTYPACQAEARRLRAVGAKRLQAPSAALLPGGARGWRVEGGLQPGHSRDGLVTTLFGRRPDLVGWAVVREGYPDADVLSRVRHF